MKNIHIIPTDKPTGIFKSGNNLVFSIMNIVRTISEGFHIYITSDEEIKEGDWVINNLDKLIGKSIRELNSGEIKDKEYSKIILTTDQDLIADGVQAIDDEFLQWFVKNPSCEEVKIVEKQHFEADKSKRKNPLNGVYYSYKIIIPKEKLSTKLHIGEIPDESYPESFRKEQPKQETLEEFISKSNTPEGLDQFSYEKGLEDGAKWQQERMYSEEEAYTIWKAGQEYWKTSGASITFEELTEQFKKK